MSAIQGKPKLTYFAGRGLAEIVRLTLAQAGVAYDDVRVDDISSLKGKLPFGQVPFYEEGDFQLSQSITIARYIARQSGLYGKDAKEAAQIDLILDGLGDVRSKAYALRSVPADKKEEETKKFAGEVLPVWTGYFEKLVSKGDWAVGNAVSLADIALFNGFSSLKSDYPDVLKNAPKLHALVDRVAALPNIAKWLAARPVTPW